MMTAFFYIVVFLIFTVPIAVIVIIIVNLVKRRKRRRNPRPAQPSSTGVDLKEKFDEFMDDPNQGYVKGKIVILILFILFVIGSIVWSGISQIFHLTE